MLKTKTKVIICTAGIVSAVTAFSSCILMPSSSATPCTTSPCNTTFQVNVKETLSVSITPDSTGNTGDVGDFLSNKITVDVATNNPSGFAASMYPQNSSLVNSMDSSKTIATLSADTAKNSVNDKWGYSLDDNTYKAMNGTSAYPTNIFPNKSASATTGHQDVYFGTKATTSTASGTYTGTVIINVVSGINTVAAAPADSATPLPTGQPSSGDPAIATSTAAYNASPIGGSSSGTTTYTYSSTPSGGLTTTTTQVSDGDNTSAYNGYTPPQGVSNSNHAVASVNSNIANNNSSLATGLAITSAVTAAAGLTFFIIAKRSEDDEDEDDIS